MKHVRNNRCDPPTGDGRVERDDACCPVRNVHYGLPGVQDEAHLPNKRELHCIDALVPRIQAWSTSRANF